jgi:hypothetical protein
VGVAERGGQTSWKILRGEMIIRVRSATPLVGKPCAALPPLVIITGAMNLWASSNGFWVLAEWGGQVIN